MQVFDRFEECLIGKHFREPLSQRISTVHQPSNWLSSYQSLNHIHVGPSSYERKSKKKTGYTMKVNTSWKHCYEIVGRPQNTLCNCKRLKIVIYARIFFSFLKLSYSNLSLQLSIVLILKLESAKFYVNIQFSSNWLA